MPRHTSPRAQWPRRPHAARRLGLCAGVLLCWAVTSQARAQSPEGTYQASPAQVTAQVEKWGDDCGVRPSSYTLKQQPKVPVLMRGKQLLLQFPSGGLRTDRCWSKNPALTVRTTRAEGGSWWTRCSTPKGDPKSEAGVYEVVATDARTLQLTESSRYDWQLKKSHCVASVRIERTLERVRGAAARPPTTSPEKPTATSAKPATPAADEQAEGADPLDAVCVPGDAAKLRLSPAAVTAEPGQRVCFAARAADANGCSIQRPKLHWRVRASGHGKASMHGACFRSANSAAEGEDRYRITARLGSVSAHATVNVRTPDLSDITAHNVLAEASPLLQPTTESTPTTTPRPVETHVKAHSVPPEEAPWLWVPLALAGALVLGVGAWLATRRGSSARVSAAPMSQTRSSRAGPRSEPSSAKRTAGPDAASAEQMICPTCRQGYPPGTQKCTKDGTPLVTYKSFNAPTAPSAERACKDCGATFKGDTVFCGKCGARLS